MAEKVKTEDRLARVISFKVTEEQFKKIRCYLCAEDLRFAVMEYIANIYED